MKLNNHYKTKPAPDIPTESKKSEAIWKFNTGWIFALLALILMSYVLKNICPSLTWERVMDYLGVKNRAAYTRLFHLFLVVTLIVAAVKILGQKKDGP